MLSCARAILDAELPTLATLVKEHPGAPVLCIGHSLGGGVASLLACLLREEPRCSAALRGAGHVSALGYGSPPALSAQVAERCKAFITTLVHNVRGRGWSVWCGVVWCGVQLSCRMLVRMPTTQVGLAAASQVHLLVHSLAQLSPPLADTCAALPAARHGAPLQCGSSGAAAH
jgi:pimeloyl-ACP methyl ester carboxylesterase